MPYVERVTKAGNTIEIERYFTSRYKKKGISRGDKVKPTKEEQEKVNTRQAERKLRILINANYGYGDYHLVLDYIRRKGEPDRTPEQMRQDIDVFLRECRKEYRKAGLEFKYIHVMEIGKKGARHTVGVAEFFALLYIAYEVVSIFKNMALCGLPVKKVWEKVREFLAKYTDELPDTDELDGDSTTGNVEEHRTQER